MGTISPEGTPHVFYMGTAVLRNPSRSTWRRSAIPPRSAHTGQPQRRTRNATPGYETVVTISGLATMETSAAVKKRVWDKVPLSGRYFSGPDSPQFGVIKVTAKRVTLQTSDDGHHESHVAQI